MQNKDKFNSMFHGTKDIVSLIDTDHTILLVNKAYEKLLKRSAHECVGKKCYALIGNNETPCDDCPILTVKEEDKPSENLIIPIGDEKISLTRHPVYNQEGSIRGIFEIGQIITENLKMRHELQHQGRLKIMGEFAASIVHEIKNPLAGIGLMTISLLERVKKKDEIYKDLKNILHEIRRLEKLLKNLMNFARPSSYTPDEADIHHSIDTTLKILNKKFKLDNIIIKKQYGLEIPKVLIDSPKMQQVFFNIFLNSIIAMPNGGQINITTTILSEKEFEHMGKGHVQIIISDTGIGIKEEDIPFVFDPFFSRSSKGTGLGLSIVNRIIELHNGNITLHSQEGVGTSVTINLPINTTL